ncbi:MAG TPA: hypothetical protein VLC10_00625 [Patescibacteria group bacterium]|nr:hypothetical protein [Patescibacteria group bacterium]
MSRRLAALRLLIEPRVRDRGMLARFLAALGPLYAAADAGEFRLAKADDFDHGAVKMAISVATGRAANGLLLLTPGRMAPKIASLLRWRSLGDALRERYEKPIRARLEPEFRAALDAHVQDVELALAVALWESVWDDAPDECLDGPPDDVLHGVRTAVWCFAALTALEDDEARQLAPLIRLIATGVLIGESADLPGTWVLLTAAP